MNESTAQPTQDRLIRRLLNSLATSQPQTVYLRDGDLVLYRRRRSRSLLYQCRYKLTDGSWHRQTTGKASLEQAIARACDLYDESKYRQKLRLAHQAHSFAQIAQICLDELRRLIDLKKTKSSLNDYASIIERYFVPYFGERQLETLTHSDVREFELWRDRRLSRAPKTSTLNNFASAWNRVIATAVDRGFISEHVPVPRLSSKGGQFSVDDRAALQQVDGDDGCSEAGLNFQSQSQHNSSNLTPWRHCSEPHFFDLITHVDWRQLHLRMFIGIHTKQFICKGLSNLINTFKVKNNFLESIKSSN
jgi:hypothetical protein